MVALFEHNRNNYGSVKSMKDNALYLEVDEDITSAIDKLSKSPAGLVQIVVPKRSTMLQSIINLKLLKKAADQSGRELVLVTNDRIANDLAARVGLAVAPSIGAKPVLGEAVIPEALKSHEEIINADDPEPPAPAPEPKVKASNKPLLKRLPVSDGPPPTAAESAELAIAATETGNDPEPVPGASAKKPPKVPNFGKLRRRVMWVAAAGVLVGGYLLAMYVFTSAKVTLYAAGTKVEVDTTFAADPGLKSTDQAKSVLAAQLVTESKDLSGPFVPTGKQDAGTKAGGTVTVVNNNNKAYDFVAGTRFQAPDGKIFRSTADIHIDPATATIVGFPPKAVIVPTKKDVAVTADANGDSFNEAPAAYSIPGLSAAEQQGINGQGAQMSGGTTKTVTIVAQTDVDGEKAALLAKDSDTAARDLQGRVPSGYVALVSSQTTTADTVTPSPAVGAQGDTATLAVKVTYTVLAVKQADYSALLHAQEQKQVGGKNQIYDDGLGAAQVTASDKDSSGRQTFHLTTEAYSGAKLDKAAIAAQLKGQRFGDASTAASGLPGVTRADITIVPGWVSRMPSRPDKISVTITVAADK